ncbi:hypothetical protein [Legionella israelensis]|uniref:Protein LvrA n=1 Tax=Legionella israelensis TaxID=454 RepID=A0A0W0W1A2_9GAMM|nr:hypothetical protein [Legionella israelensis]KTD26049.1 protein LvrA [Legionella israelensis]QBS10160.1 Vir protein [Legionella israelensis]SCY26352.1 hypothetical protein SAMN02746069_01820 [Legionella israelensis DSM 19235]STX59751.1 protein LvrA [Legionella israelensis]
MKQEARNFIFISCLELDALCEIPHMQRLVYIMGIRPHMDRKTLMVGIKRKISYQSLREALYVAPIRGVKTGCPSHQQMKRAIKSLARQGIIEIHSTAYNLVVKCPLADTRLPTQQEINSKKSQTEYLPQIKNATLRKNHSSNSVINHQNSQNKVHLDLCTNEKQLQIKFEQFWKNYPLPAYMKNAWDQFKKLNPDDALFESILQTLARQKDISEESQSSDAFSPYSMIAAEWLIKQQW